MSCHFCPLLGGAAVAVALAACAPPSEPEIFSIDIIGFGIFEYGAEQTANDPNSPLGAQITRAKEVRIAQQTDRIPLREGLAYGVAFVVHGDRPGAVVPIDVRLRSTAPCVLKSSGETVYENESTLSVRLGEVRHIGGRIPTAAEDHCANAQAPGTDTLVLSFRGRQFAEKRFYLFEP